MSDTRTSEANSEELVTSDELRNDSQSEAVETGTSDINEASTDQEEGTSEEEWLIPGRFKKGEEDKLAKSFREMESLYSRTKNEMHKLRSSGQPTTSQVDPDQELEAFAKKLKENPLKAIREFSGVEKAREEIQSYKFEAAYNQAMANPEFAELEPIMMQIVDNNSDLILNNMAKNDPRLLDILFLAAKGIKQKELTEQAENRGKRQGERSALKKTKAQVEGASGSKGHIQKNIEEMTVEEMEKAFKNGSLSFK